MNGTGSSPRQGARGAGLGALAGGRVKSAYRGSRAFGRGCLAWGCASGFGRGAGAGFGGPGL